MKQAIEVSLDDLGRITIPAPLKEQLGLSPGMTLVVEEGDQDSLRLRIEPKPQLVDKGGVLVLKAEAIPNLADVTRRERDQRVLDLLHRAGL